MKNIEINENPPAATSAGTAEQKVTAFKSDAESAFDREVVVPGKTAAGQGRGRLYEQCVAIFGTAPGAVKHLAAKKAAEIRRVWDYRTAGLTAAAARKLIAETLGNFGSGSREERNSRGAKTEHPRSEKIDEYYERQEQRRKERAENSELIGRAALARNIDEINDCLKGYNYGYSCRIELGEEVVVIERREYCTWDKKKHWPTSTSTDYMAHRIGANLQTVASVRFDSRRGDWLQALGVSLGLQTGDRTPLTQSGALIPHSKKMRHGIRLTALRLYASGFSVYCAEAWGLNFHARDEASAVRGLVKKRRADMARKPGRLDGRAILTREAARRLGFCETGVAAFLAEIGLDEKEEAKVSEIRAAMREHDLSPWAEELKLIGLL